MHYAVNRPMQKRITNAMADQLDRVNGGSLAQRAGDLEVENGRLRLRLQLQRDKIAELEAETELLRQEIDQLQAAIRTSGAVVLPAASAPAAPPDDPNRPAATMRYKGRPASTPKAVADWCAVSHSTIIRHLKAGKIAGEQMPDSNRWIVYTDRPIGPFRR